MRKTIIIGVVALLSIASMYGFSDAVVTGRCDNCHTMHASQNGTSTGINLYSGETLPRGVLLRGSCAGCHSEDTASEWQQSVTSAPVVWNTNGSTSYGYNNEGLAAGNFENCDADTEEPYGHNVDLVTTEVDTIIGAKTPPGFIAATSDKPAVFTQSGSGWGPATWASVQGKQVTCAGVYGCHGDRSTANDDSYKGIRGAHHAIDTSIDGTTIGKSYRFLAGIIGVEDSDWEKTNGSTDHNGYRGDDAGFDDDSSISFLCAECHGLFHAHTSFGGTDDVGSASPWLRHPTDIALTASSGSLFTTDYTTYSVETPVALATPSTNTSTVSTTSRVICLSCHRAHASPNYDLLRWTYSSMNAGQGAGSGTGCLRCHKRQR